MFLRSKLPVAPANSEEKSLPSGDGFSYFFYPISFSSLLLSLFHFHCNPFWVVPGHIRGTTLPRPVHFLFFLGAARYKFILQSLISVILLAHNFWLESSFLPSHLLQRRLLPLTYCVVDSLFLPVRIEALKFKTGNVPNVYKSECL